MSAPKQVFVVSHTHWDREWYWPFSRFRVRLVDVVAEVLDRLENEEGFDHFLLDGQAAALDDYLEARPEDRSRIAALVEAGKLSIGPWFVLSDTFLVSGEATVRNLLFGDAVCREFGGASKAGYVPDAFGHIAQMPQLLKKTGIDSFVYQRGNGDEIDDLGLEWTWRAPDGSEVLAIQLLDGYCNAAALGHEELWHAFTRRTIDPERAVTKVKTLLEKMDGVSAGSVRLLMNGCDHHPPQRDFDRILAALREAYPETEFHHAALGEFLEAVREEGREAPVWSGELREGKWYLILSGVWSARMYLKQANDACQTMLAGVAEPILASAHFLHGAGYPAGLLDAAWRQLLLNHPHDSICGCSIDSVHREMETRFAGVRQTGEQLLNDVADRLAPSFAPDAADDHETVIAVVNPRPVRRTEVVERLVVLQPEAPDHEELALYDEAGNSVPFTIEDVRYVERFWGIDYREARPFTRLSEQFEGYRAAFPERMDRGVERKDESDCFFNLRFVAKDLPPLGHASFFLEPRREADAGPTSDGGVLVAGDTIENEHLSATLHPDGTFDLTDKATGEEFAGLNLLSDTEDIGDEYDYCAAPDSQTLTARGAEGEVATVLPGGLVGSIEATFILSLPASIHPDRQRRGESRVSCPVRVRVTLQRDARAVDVSVEVENRAEDHRLVAEFPTGIVSETLVSDGPFTVHERPIDGPSGKDWAQPPTETFPQQEFSLVEGDGRGLAVFSRGLPEVAAARDGDGRTVMKLTLLRAVGWLSRDDFESRRRCNAGPTIPTPDAQCPGVHRFHYAVAPYGGDRVAAGLARISDLWRHPVLTKQGVRAGLVPGGAGLFETSDVRTVVTAVKRHRERDTLVVRLSNPTPDPVEETLTFGRPVAAAWRTDLLESREADLPVATGTIGLTLTPHEIATLEISFCYSGSDPE